MNGDPLSEQERLQYLCLFSKIGRNVALRWHFDYTCLKKGVIVFTETQTSSSDSNFVIDDTKIFNNNVNSSNYKFLILNYGCQGYITIIKHFGINGYYTIYFGNYNFTDRVFILMLAYRKKSISSDEFGRMLKIYLMQVL